MQTYLLCDKCYVFFNIIYINKYFIRNMIGIILRRPNIWRITIYISYKKNCALIFEMIYSVPTATGKTISVIFPCTAYQYLDQHCANNINHAEQNELTTIKEIFWRFCFSVPYTLNWIAAAKGILRGDSLNKLQACRHIKLILFPWWNNIILNRSFSFAYIVV